MLFLQHTRLFEHILKLVYPLLLNREECELLQAPLQLRERVIDESRLYEIQLVALHLEVELAFYLAKALSSSLVQAELINIDPDVGVTNLIEHFLKAE
mmetsp:Transcript_21859/g.29275  ORF Transcript_21859/g.29275 Transcript_21859/m.29275 type:complete len:98 (+) Transcript_21859:738-1031(+)